MALSRAVNKGVFEKDFCAAFKRAEAFFSKTRKTYPSHSDSTIVMRCENFLRSTKGRLAILSVPPGIRLDGVSTDQPGIEQCRNLVEQLDKLTGSKNATANDKSAPGCEQTQDGDATAATGNAASSGSVAEFELTSVQLESVDIDPARVIAVTRNAPFRTVPSPTVLASRVFSSLGSGGDCSDSYCGHAVTNNMYAPASSAPLLTGGAPALTCPLFQGSLIFIVL